MDLVSTVGGTVGGSADRPDSHPHYLAGAGQGEGGEEGGGGREEEGRLLFFLGGEGRGRGLLVEGCLFFGEGDFGRGEGCFSGEEGCVFWEGAVVFWEGAVVLRVSFFLGVFFLGGVF